LNPQGLERKRPSQSESIKMRYVRVTGFWVSNAGKHSADLVLSGVRTKTEVLELSAGRIGRSGVEAEGKG
jgi:hypothetical protein